MNRVRRVGGWRRWSAWEIAETLRLYRVEGWSYAKIAVQLHRNVSSVGYVIRREDARDERRERLEDLTDGLLPRAAAGKGDGE